MRLKRQIDYGHIIMILTIIAGGLSFIFAMDSSVKVNEAKFDSRMKYNETTMSKIADIAVDHERRIRANEDFRIESTARYGNSTWRGKADEKK